MANFNPHATGTLGLEWLPAKTGTVVLDAASKVAAFSMDQTLSQVIGTVGVPARTIPTRGGMYAVEVYDGESAVPVNLTVGGYATPNEDVSIGSWRNQSGLSTNLFQSIGEAANNISTADYITMSGATSRYTGRVNAASFATLTGKRILAVRFVVVALTGPTGSQKFGLNISGVNYDALFMYGATGSVKTLTKTYLTNPATGRLWTVADVTNFDSIDEWYVEGATNASVWSANLVYWAGLEVDYVDENRLAVGYLDDRASALLQPDQWNLAPMATPTGGAWTKDGSGRHLYTVRRVGDKGALAIPYLDASPAGGVAPSLGQGWDLTLEKTYGYVTGQVATPRAIPVLQRTTVPADSVDSQPYARLVGAAIYSGANAEQEYSNEASTNYAIVRFVGNPTYANPVADLSIKLKRRSDNAQLGSTYTLTLAAARAQPAYHVDGWRLYQEQLATPAGLVAGTQYFLEFSSATDIAHPWYVMAADTLASGTTASYQGTTDRAVVNGVEADRYDLVATLATPPAAPATLTVTTTDDLAQVGTGSVCCDASTKRAALAWTPTAQGANFARYEIERSDGSGWARVATITAEAVGTWSDREARRGVATTYRIRVVRTDGSFSDWRTSGPVTLDASNPSLWLTTNYGQQSMAYDYQPAKTYDFAEDGERNVLGAYLHDYSLGFNPQEWRGTTVRYTLLIAVDNRVGPVGLATRTGADAFYQLRRFAIARWPYVCLLDHRGNRHFVLLRVPSGTEEQPAARYVADVHGVEVAGPTNPFVVSIDATGEVGI